MSGADRHLASEITSFVLEAVGAETPGPDRPGRWSAKADEDKVNRQCREHPFRHRSMSTVRPTAGPFEELVVNKIRKCLQREGMPPCGPFSASQS